MRIKFGGYKIFANINSNTGGTFSNAFDLSNTPLDASNPQLIANEDLYFLHGRTIHQLVLILMIYFRKLALLIMDSILVR